MSGKGESEKGREGKPASHRTHRLTSRLRLSTNGKREVFYNDVNSKKLIVYSKNKNY